MSAEEELLLAVAWTLFAGEDATYADGEYVPDATERDLAEQFLASLRSRGFDVVRSP